MADTPTARLGTEQFKSAAWRLNNLYWLIDKGGNRIPFRTNWAQERFLADMAPCNIILKARQLGFCLEPSMRVLTADLTWTPISELCPGQEIVAVDEHAPGGKGQQRKMRTATVEGVVEVFRQAYRITLDDGRAIVCTGRHPWLSRKVATDSTWRSIEGPNKKKLTVGTKIRWIAKPWEGHSYQDGWFGGMLDGEGSISKTNVAASINVSQKLGATWARLGEYCKSRGYHFRIEDDRGERESKLGHSPVPKIVIGRMDEIFRLIGQTRPTRFLGNRFWEGRELPGKKSGIGWATITRIEPLGEQPMIDLQTSAGTYIAEGFVSHNTTFIQLLMLDDTVFHSNVRAGVIAQSRDDARAIFRDKVKYPFDNLPEALRAARTVQSDTSDELLLNNNSSIRVGTSLRGGTLQWLHVSEFGKICSKFPEKAREVMTGALNTIQAGQFANIESTAEGQHGKFFDLCQTAREQQRRGVKLTPVDFKFHFYAWHEEPGYTLDPTGVEIPAPLLAYFEKLERDRGIHLTAGQRAWYAKKHQTQGADMKREFPATPDEAFEAAVEGAYFGTLLAQADDDRRIGPVPHDPSKPVHISWDLGVDDSTAIWFMQRQGSAWRFIDFYQASGYTLPHYAKELDRRPYRYGACILPHDGKKRELGGSGGLEGDHIPLTTKKILESLGFKRVKVMPMRPKQDSINGIRQMLPRAYFDAEKCADGLKALRFYHREWDDANGTWKATPAHDWSSHPTDSLAEMAAANPQDEGLFSQPLEQTVRSYV